MKPWLLLPLLALLTACNPGRLLEKMAGAESQQIARDYIQRLKAGDLEKLAAELDPSLRNDQTPGVFKAMQDLIPAGEPTETQLVGFQSQVSLRQKNHNFTYQFNHGGKWLLVVVAWRQPDAGPRMITGLRVIPLQRSLQETNAFTFKHAGPQHYVFLAGLVAIPAFVVVTLVTCIRTKFPRRKWLWILFIIAGCFLQFSLNWTTGEMAIKPLYLQFFGAGAMAAGVYAPWVISLAVPVGAIAFWFKRRRLLAAAAATPPVLPADNG